MVSRRQLDENSKKIQSEARKKQKKHKEVKLIAIYLVIIINNLRKILLKIV